MKRKMGREREGLKQEGEEFRDDRGFDVVVKGRGSCLSWILLVVIMAAMGRRSVEMR